MGWSRWSRPWPHGWRRPARGSAPATASSPVCSPLPTRPQRATRCASSSKLWGAWRSASRSIRGMSTDAATLPDALSDAARSFVSGPHRFVMGGERPEAADGRTFETIDPSTGRAITEVPYAGVEDVDRAVRAAREAFEDGRWSKIAAAERTRAILAFADAVDEHADELSELESLDNGKPVKLARRVDVPLASAHLRYFAGWPTRINGEVLPVAQPNMHCYTRKEPVGVAAQIIPWNFPLLMAAWKVAPALAAGCTIVLKPAEQTPLTAIRFAELALEAHPPAGRVEGIPGAGERGGEGRLPGDLLQHRPGLQRRVAAVRAQGPVRRRAGGPFRGGRQGATRRRARPRHADGAAHLRGAGGACSRLHRVGQVRGRRARHGREQARRRGLLRGAHAVQRHGRQADHRARGDLRPGARGAAIRLDRGGRAPRE